ncbi:spinster family MFS transporter [Pseudomonas yamanorum]|uniref:MFS transporter n=1 Tax=Pseudomonas yamanorum TaxID=515393 RepID=A0A7Y8FEB8_9PSED|nr:MFS transporter [Pseudomonas yamanorum]NWE77806.1 MFS transporter [Pseudomonas yamanorum]
MGITPSRNIFFALSVLFLINLMNYFDRSIPAVVLESIGKEFSLTDTSLGIIAIAFTLVHAMVGVPLGYVADRFTRTRVISIGVALWSLLTAASGAAWSFTSFLLARAGVGIGEASFAPAANSLIADLVPSSKRARAIGLFMLGYPIGTFLCYYFVGLIAQVGGWRLPFILAAIPGVLLALLILLVREPIRGGKDSKTSVSRTSIFSLIRMPVFVWLCVFCSFMNMSAYGLVTFLPTLLMRVHGLNVSDAGAISSIVLGGTGLVGLTLGAWLADKFHQKFNGGRLILGAFSMFASTPLLWAGLSSPPGNTQSLLIFLTIGWLLYFIYFVTVYPTLLDIVDASRRGVAMAIVFFFANVLGGGIGTLLTGVLSDRFANEAMLLAGAVELTAADRAIGLNLSLQYVVPAGIFLGGMTMLFALRSYRAMQLTRPVLSR